VLVVVLVVAVMVLAWGVAPAVGAMVPTGNDVVLPGIWGICGGIVCV